MRHPTDSELALYAGGDLPALERWRVQYHVHHCDSCRGEVEGFRTAVLELRNTTAGLPANFDWDRVTAEITANIHLGLEAGECVTPAKAPAPRVSWRAVAVMASVSIVVAAGWWLNPPQAAPTLVHRAAAAVEIGTTSGGIELKENGNALVLLNGRSGETARPIIVSAPGTLRARYVDADTGQITINNVYAE
jgi:hypothetical protein